MTGRILTALSVAVAVAALAPMPVVAQTDTANWTLPRTPWGDPDLQGIWNNITSTPLERPRELGPQEFYTEEQAVELARQRLQRIDRDRRDGTPEADVGRAYNEFWSDRGTKYLTQLNRRTSLILDPPDGRLPPRTPEGQARVNARADARQRSHSWEDRRLWERCLTRGVPRLPGS